MSKVAVVYWSSTGNTEAMANEVADGVQAAGGQQIWVSGVRGSSFFRETSAGIRD